MADPTAFINLIGDAASGYAYIGGGQRSIGTFIPDIVVAELHHDHMSITKHPVETGAAISDHCFMENPVVEMQCGASNSTGRSEGYVQAVYAQVLALQAERKPFNVSTGKRQYQNMLISDIIVTTDETKEFVLDFTVKLERVTIVSTQTSSSGGAASNSNQGTPATTSSPTDSGNQSLQATYGVPDFAAQSNAQLWGPSTVAPASFGDGIDTSASSAYLNEGGVQPSPQGGNSNIYGAPDPGATVWGP